MLALTTRLALATAIPLFVSSASAQVPPPSPAVLAQRADKTLECSRPEADRTASARAQRHWCALTSVSRNQFVAPGKRRVLVGLSVRLGAEQDLLSALRSTPELAVLTLDKEGALVTSLQPEDAGEKKSYMGVLASLMLVLKHKDNALHLSKKLEKHLKSFEQEKLHPYLARSGLFEGLMLSQIFSVTGVFGEGYIVIENDEQSQRLNLFPIVPFTSDEGR